MAVLVVGVPEMRESIDQRIGEEGTRNNDDYEKKKYQQRSSKSFPVAELGVEPVEEGEGGHCYDDAPDKKRDKRLEDGKTPIEQGNQ